MKCANCHSPMFVADETATSRSQVTFYRCSICVSEHVSAEPIAEYSLAEFSQFETVTAEASYAGASETKRYLMI